MVVFDATMMLLAIKPNVNPPIDEATGRPVENAEARINALIEKLEKEKTKIIIPAPALSELLVRAGIDIQSIINRIRENPVFRIEPFDTRGAVEVALMARQAINGGNKRGHQNSVWAKIKYDRQIVAIAKINRATTIYSDDGHIHTLGDQNKIRVVRLADLPIPDKDRQGIFDFESKSEGVTKDNSNEEKIENNQTDHKE